MVDGPILNGLNALPAAGHMVSKREQLWNAITLLLSLEETTVKMMSSLNMRYATGMLVQVSILNTTSVSPCGVIFSGRYKISQMYHVKHTVSG